MEFRRGARRLSTLIPAVAPLAARKAATGTELPFYFGRSRRCNSVVNTARFHRKKETRMSLLGLVGYSSSAKVQFFLCRWCDIVFVGNVICPALVGMADRGLPCKWVVINIVGKWIAVVEWLLDLAVVQARLGLLDSYLFYGRRRNFACARFGIWSYSLN